MTQGVTVAMERANPFNRISIRSDSIVNKAVTTYRINVEGTVNAQDGDVLEVGFPE